MTTRRWLLLLCSMAIGAGAFLLLRPTPCTSSAQKLASIWDEPRRLELRASFAANPAALKAVEAAFDAFASSWSPEWDQTCAADQRPPEAVALHRVCLDGRLAQLAALSQLFSGAAPGVVANAPLSVGRLSGFGPCNPAIAAAPAEALGQLARAQRKIARSEVLRHAGQPADALLAANEGVALAEASSHPPTLAQALLSRAEGQQASGRLEEAAKTLEQGRTAAEAGRDFETLIRICLAHLRRPATPDQAELWLTRGEQALEQLPHPPLRAELDLAIAGLRLEQDRLADAEAAAQRAHQGFDRTGQPARRLEAGQVLARALSLQGKRPEAIALARTTGQGFLELLGKDHPHTLQARVGIAQTLLRADRPEDSLATLASLTETQLASLPPLGAAAALCVRGRSHSRLLSPAGLGELKRCVALLAGALGERHPTTASGHDALAAGWRLQPALPEAIAEHELAIAGFGELRSPEAAAAHASYAVTLLAQGDATAAAEWAKTALAIFGQVAPPRAINRCAALWALAEAGLRLKSPSAEPEARAALECLAAQPRHEGDLARASLTLATALGRTPEAVTLLKTAATHPSVKLAALDALAALRAFDPEAGCAAAIEALVREGSPVRERAARGCKLPRLP